MKPREKVEIVDKTLDIARANQLSNKQKNILFEMINNSDKTEKQKDRFIKYYNLDINQEQIYTYTTLAKEYGCTSSSIKPSFYGIRQFLLKDENAELLKKIMKV